MTKQDDGGNCFIGIIVKQNGRKYANNVKPVYRIRKRIYIAS
ncbi:hypothetical protein ACFPN4_10325 [Ureibacillus thermophilus]|nr:hypothetical protein [Ureibacillus thermophilus]